MKKLEGEMRIWTLEQSSRLATLNFWLKLDDLEDEDGYLPPGLIRNTAVRHDRQDPGYGSRRQ